MKPRAITGVGVVSPLGIGRRAFFEAMAAGTQARPSDGHVEIADFDPTKYLGDKGLRSLDRLTKILLVASRLALHDSRLKSDGAWTGIAGEQVGLVCSNAYGSLEAITELDRVAILEDRRYINPARFPLTVANSAAGYASIWEDVRAVNVTVSDGNCGGLDAVACADAMLEHARARVLLVGGAEAMSDALLLAFRKIGALGGEAFLGEGAALVALETPESARARQVNVLGEVVGYGTSFCAPDRESAIVFPSSPAMEDAITAALHDAAIAPGDVDVVISGASGLPAFDEAELTCLRKVLGSPRIVTPKRALGETLGAGGAMGMVAALAMLNAPNDAPNDPKLRGDVRTPPAAPRTALVTSLGYHGNASALVMRGPLR